MHSIVLNNARCNFQEGQLSEERQQMNPQFIPMPFPVSRISLTVGDDLVLAKELIRRSAETLSAFDLPRPMLPLKFEIPVLREFFRVRQTFFLCARAAVSSGEIR